MVERNNGVYGVIKLMRYVFDDGIISFDCRQLSRRRGILPEGYGVVVVDRDDGRLVAYGDSTNDEEILEKNLAGARVAYGDKAILLRKKNDFLTCRRRR